MTDLDKLTDSILEAVRAGHPVVFPSEIAASFWRRLLLRRGFLTAVREDHIVSWDRFKEQAFALRTERLPVNSALRALFVEQVLAENAATPFLRSMVPREHAGNARGFAPALTRALPALPAAARLRDYVDAQAWLLPLISDLDALSQRYTEFLERFSLYEPRWLETAPAFEGGDFMLIYPELAEDFPEFEAALKNVPRISVPKGPLPELGWYENSRMELITVMNEVAALLDAGERPEEIVITVCGLDRLRERVLQLARRLEVPVSLGMGIPLAESAPGRFFAAMREVVQAGFGVESLKALVLTPAVPWHDYPINAAIIREGVEHGIIGGAQRPDSGWKRLRPSAAKDRIHALIHDLPAIVRAPSATELRKRYFAFAGKMIDADRWDSEQERVLQRCLEELAALAELEERFELSIPDPFSFWMERLRGERYVPAEREYGVSVLPYRVGAGVLPLHHFLVNANNRELSVQIDRFPFLSEAEREQLGSLGAPHELTASFVAAYAVSGEVMHASGSGLTFEGPALPPTVFVASEAVAEREPGAADPFALERIVGSPSVTQVVPIQRAGATAYAAAEERPGIDLTQNTLSDPELVQRLLLRQGANDHPELLMFAPNNFELYLSCPFSYLLSRPLGVEDLEYEVDASSPRVIGSLYHDALKRFFGELRSTGDVFDASQIDRYEARLGSLLDEEIAKSRGVPDFVHEANRPLYDRVIGALLESDAKLIAGHTATDVETWQRLHHEALDILLVGRVDRVTRSPSGDLTLVDYKRRKTPAKGTQNGGNASAVGIEGLSESELDELAASISSFQIPFYIFMIESHGQQVETALYYSLEEGEATAVFYSLGEASLGKPVMTRDRMDEVVVMLERRLGHAAAGIRAGDYRCGSCETCHFRSICRSRFVVR
ncbi:MAG: PD-(D/E)XK nuclease family protein [Spirochaetales bacterium]